MIPLDFKKASGLITTVIQDATTKQVLMVAYMNAESLEKTMTTGETWFWSRSRTCYGIKAKPAATPKRFKLSPLTVMRIPYSSPSIPLVPLATLATPVVFIVSIQKGRAPNDNYQTKHYRII